jgi:hypothetical protein
MLSTCGSPEPASHYQAILEGEKVDEFIAACVSRLLGSIGVSSLTILTSIYTIRSDHGHRTTMSFDWSLDP